MYDASVERVLFAGIVLPLLSVAVPSEILICVPLMVRLPLSVSLEERSPLYQASVCARLLTTMVCVPATAPAGKRRR
jgi:hypothetical protein